jgi:peptidoglycan LD-endopeptidase LytH
MRTPRLPTIAACLLLLSTLAAVLLPANALAAPATQTPTARLPHIFPVQRAARISYGRYHHDYPAADIFCPVGSNFVAPTSGVVDSVDRVDRWNPKVDDPSTRGGLAVAIVGDDGVRYYGSHLSSIAAGIAPGVRVKAGQLLGKTGKTGNARYTPPHLHFGISRPTTPDDWQTRRGQVAPYPYLKAWQQGRNVIPTLPLP